jgi:hypothetical protein
MKREELLAKGYTEEQVTDLLNTFHSINSENKLLKNEVQAKQDLVNQNLELQRQLDEINKANMSEQERITKEKADADKYYSDAKKIYNTAKAKEILAGLDIDEQLITTLVSEDENATINNATLLKNRLESLKESTIKQTKESIANLDIKPTPTNIPQENNVMTVEKFNSMTLSDQVMWKKENGQEYEQLFNK